MPLTALTNLFVFSSLFAQILHNCRFPFIGPDVALRDEQGGAAEV